MVPLEFSHRLLPSRKQKRRKFTASRQWLAGALSWAADRIAPERETPAAVRLTMNELLKLPDIGRVDFEALRIGQVEVLYTALDPIWKADPRRVNDPSA